MLLLNALNGTSALMALFMLKLIVHRLNKKVNLCIDRPKGVLEVEAPRISRQSAHEGGKIVSPTLRPPLPPPPPCPALPPPPPQRRSLVLISGRG